MCFVINKVFCLCGLLRWLSGKESTYHCRRHRFDTWFRKILWRRKWQPIPVFLSGKSHGQRSLMGYSPWSLKGKRSVCNAGDPGSIPGSGRSTGEGNGNPFQYSSLVNPLDSRAWRATVHGVSKGWVQLGD